MADAIVSIVAEQMATILKEQIQNEVNLVRGVENEMKSLSKELENVKNELEDAGRKQFAEEGVKAWLVRLEATFTEMEDVLDEWQIALRKFQIQQQSNDAPIMNKVCSFISCLCFKKVVVRRDIASKIKNVKDKLYVILAEKDRYSLDTSTTTQPPLERETISLVDLAEVHGRDRDRDVVASKIFRTEERQLVEIVSIVGVGGVGKTTLAQMVFNDSRVKDCFELSIWICVSDIFDVAEIVKKIVESVTGSSPESNQLEVLVQVHLKACISGKKSLLVLDDVWTEDHTKWEHLKISLKSCCGIGSKILVTTRKEMVAKTLDTLENEIHHLGVLSDESCWLLLKRIALFGRGEEECAKYRDIGMGIVDKCKGLPLAVKTMGSLLRCKKKNISLEEWENVLKSDVWELEKAQVEIFPHLLLSYNELSPALKRCFSYCAVYPKDSTIIVEEVINKWMALGYLGYGDDIDMEDKGRQYFDNLAMRSLFQDFTRYDSSEWIYSFKLHDIVHDFAQYLRKNGTAAASATVVEVEAGTNKKKMMCCGETSNCSPELVYQVKQYRSLHWDNDKDSLICGCLGSLWVLSLTNYWRAPKGMEKLIHLRWLDLSESIYLSGEEGLETICNELLNLETLLLRDCALQQIPRGIGNLIRLTHLDLSWNKSLKELPREIGNLIRLRHLDLNRNKCIKELPREIGNLVQLRHLDLSDNKSIKELPREIGNLIHLKALGLGQNESLKELPREIGNLIRLRHLDLSRNESLKELPENICGLGELETLDIGCCDLLSKLPQGIHRLENLKHLCNYDTTSLRQFPQGISQLTSLRTLDEFRVGRDMGKVGWLKDLNRLSGYLKLVINLTGNIMDVEDAREGELRNKEYLKGLDIVFDDDDDDDEDESDGIQGVEEDWVWVDVLDALQPHTNLQSLIIQHFHGSRLPGWIVSPLNQVKTIDLRDFGHLSSILLPLGKLPCLQVMKIEKMNELRFVGREFLGGGITTTEITTIVFPRLTTLTFYDCPNWEEWEDITAQEEDDEKSISFMPRLTELKVNKCNSLVALPHCLLRKVASSSLEEGSMKLDISRSSQLEQRYGDKEGSPSKSISHINPRIQLIIQRHYTF